MISIDVDPPDDGDDPNDLISNAPDPHDPGLTENHWRAISALLEGKSIVATAEHCNVNERTIRRWLRNTAFNIEYHNARRARAVHITSRVTKAVDKATATIEGLMDCGVPSIQLRAANIICQMSRTSTAFDKLEAETESLTTMKNYIFDDVEQRSRADRLQLELERAAINRERAELRTQQSEMSQQLGHIERERTQLEQEREHHEEQLRNQQKIARHTVPSPPEWETLRVALIQGTFRRPAWISRECWEQIITAEYTTPATSSGPPN